MMTRQEKEVQLKALAREIEGHEIAISNMTERMTAAEERGDEEEVRRLADEIAGSEKTIKVAKEQMGLLSPEGKVRQERGRTSEASSRSTKRAGSKA